MLSSLKHRLNQIYKSLGSIGSSVQIDFNWNDGSAPIIHNMGNGVDWPGPPINEVSTRK